MVLLSLLCLKALIVPALFVNYELRKDFIIRNYCVNKDRPELHCDGKCYLAKQIRAAEQQDEKQATDTFLNKVFQVESRVGLMSFSFEPQATVLTDEVSFNYFCSFPSVAKNSVFHPPQA